MTGYELLQHRLDVIQLNIHRLKNTPMGNFWLSVLYSLKYKMDIMTIAEAEKIF